MWVRFPPEQIMSGIYDGVDALNYIFRRRTPLPEKYVTVTTPGDKSSLAKALWDDRKKELEASNRPFGASTHPQNTPTFWTAWDKYSEAESGVFIWAGDGI